jgi:hypothetical protein
LKENFRIEQTWNACVLNDFIVTGFSVVKMLILLRQFNGKNRAFAECRGDGNFAAVKPRQMFDDCQTQTGSADFARAGAVCAVKAFENSLQMFAEIPSPVSETEIYLFSFCEY